MNSCIHAREWVAPMTALYFIWQVLSTYNSNSRVKELLDSVNIHFIPITNPDGFVFSHTSGQRYWRKNRNRQFGVDLNRNWPPGWGGRGSSRDPRSDVYCGPSAISEPESQAIDNYLRANNGNRQMKAGLDVHTYAEVIMRPYAYTDSPSRDESRFAALGNSMVDGIRSVSGKVYRNMRLFTFFPASGVLSDHYYVGHQMAGMGIELFPRGFGDKEQGLQGFSPPASAILPCARENYAGLLNLLTWVKEN